jgi:hypothetical protein
MLPFTALLVRASLAPFEFARAYCEAFASAAPNVRPRLSAPKVDPSNGSSKVRDPESRVPSYQSGDSDKVMSTQFYDNQVATVSYQILFTKRDKEALLEEKTTTVAKMMTGSGFASWKIAQFVTDQHGFPAPREWQTTDLNTFTTPVSGPPDRYTLKPEYYEFLQVDYQVINTFDRKPPQDEIGALREIATAIKSKP